MPRALRNFLLFLLLLSLTLWALCARPRPAHLRVLTFNIENYPRSAEQEAGAFAAIAAAGAPAVAVQEITDPAAFDRAARARLGPSWRFLAAEDPTQLHVGLLYDSARLELLSSRTRTEVVTYPGARPALEARVRPVGGGQALRLLVVHLKAGGDGAELRRGQLAALRPVLAELLQSGDRVLALGDFNAATPGDRAELQALSRSAGLSWATQELPCTAYWDRRDGCLGSALDQALSSAPARAAALDPCQSEGCALRPACPTFRERVSDHCPVALDL